MKRGTMRTMALGALTWLALVAPAVGCGSSGQEQRLGTVMAELIQFGLNNHVCIEGAVGECGTDEVTTCTGDCVTPRLVDESCAPFACHPNSVCAEDLDGTGRASTSCVYEFGTGWTCRPFDAASNPGMALFNECDPTDSYHPCPADGWCKDVGTCNGVTLGSTDHMCVTYQTHGRLCDGDFIDSGCALCAPGTDCNPENTGYAGSSGRCRKPCTTADDCPCEDDGDQEHICHDDGYCHKCRDEGEACDDNYVCCDESLKCEGTCCRELDEVCTADKDCCEAAGETCINETCAPCRNNFESCGDNADCCEGACVGGTCRPDCELMAELGEECSPDGTKGPCAEDGYWACDESFDAICVQTVFPDTETCNNIDDDCDGSIDNNVQWDASTCPITPGGCQAGFSTTGHKTCDGGVPGCEAEPFEDYCNSCGYQGSNDCGSCSLCTVGSCPPNYRCNQTTWTCDPVSTTAPACNPAGPGYAPKCWKFDDVGTGETVCCGECLP